jgi:multidrug resistance efflux pump
VLDDEAARALKTLVEAQSTAGITREEIDKLTENYRRAAFAATAMGRQAAAASDKATDSTKKTNQALEDQYQLQRKLQEHTSSFTVTAANFDQYTAPQGLQKGSIPRATETWVLGPECRRYSPGSGERREH